VNQPNIHNNSGVPAPTNLSIPPHYYESENVLIIGEDEEVT